MKKILIALALLLAFVLAAVYLFIPGKIKIQATTSLKAALPGVSRTLTNDTDWAKWWPGTAPFIYDGQAYSIQGKIFNDFDIDIQNEKDTLDSRMELILIKADTMSITWEAGLPGSSNPFQRFSNYRQAKRTEKNMQLILDSMKAFMEKPENIYGFPIIETTVKDSVLISTRRSFDHKPSIQDIDAMIQSMKKYIIENKAEERNFPMLNVFQLDSSHYEAMTAIPVDRELPLTKEFAPKFLLKRGNILETEVRGGPYKIETGLNELENYKNDYKFTSPAIPYQLLVTDRLKEQDTAKWVTRLYYPVY